MNINFNTSQFDLEKIRKVIENKIVDVRNKTLIRVYNIIATMDEYPYWSGTYMASFNISVGSPDMSHVPLPTNSHGQASVHYARPRERSLGTVTDTNPYQTGYITNAVPHAYKVEFVGTPKHPDPWMIAHHAVNSVRTSLRFF